jgi:cupin 2 domain-containing protein
MKNLYDVSRPPDGAESVATLLQRGGVRIERILSNRAATDWYDQTEDEWIVLLEGAAELQIGKMTLSLQRGDTLLLKAHQRHRVVSTSEDALWLAVFIPDSPKSI